MLGLAIDVYSLLVLLAVIFSWIQVGEDNPIRRLTDATVEPVLARIRKVLPTMGGLDFSPLLLLFGLRFLRGML
jgi:YggT family protein